MRLTVDVDGKTYSRSVYATSASINELMGIKVIEIPYIPDPKVTEAFANLKAKKKKRDLEALINRDQKQRKKHGH